MIYDYTGNPLQMYPELYGDGVHDDTSALQDIVDNYESVILPANLVLKITSPIEIDISKCHHFDGGNSTIKATGDITAFVISGSLTGSMTANPSTLDAGIIGDEGSFIFEKCKITNANAQQGTGIEIDGCFKTNILDCYIFMLKTGIVIQNRNRDIKISGNHIYGCWLYGIHIQNTCNLHQCNIEDNIINYAYYNVFFDEPVQIANFQFTGNDIEISNYPTVNDKTGFRCMKLLSGDGIDGQFSEIEIVGNTIQGHTGSNSIIEIVGGSLRYVRQITINGNHISNCSGDMIVLNKVYDINISGNSMANAGGYCISTDGQIQSMIVGNNLCSDVGATNGGFLKNVGQLRKSTICGNSSKTSVALPFTITGSAVYDVMINGNVIAGDNTSITVKPSGGDRVMLCNNICTSGTYDTNATVTASNNI